MLSDLKWTRKAESWDEVRSDDRALDLAVGLAVYAAGPSPMGVFDGIGKPTDPAPGARPQHFVAQRSNGDLFLVDTQGYNYARYTVRISGLRIRPATQCDNCGELHFTTAPRDNGNSECTACWAASLAHGHLHGLHQDEDGNDISVEGCPDCGKYDNYDERVDGGDPACPRR